jgi:hypothetical protein
MKVGPSEPVCTEKSDSAIFVMKTAEDRLRCDDAEALSRVRERGIFAQRAMNSRLVVIINRFKSASTDIEARFIFAISISRKR